MPPRLIFNLFSGKSDADPSPPPPDVGDAPCLPEQRRGDVPKVFVMDFNVERVPSGGFLSVSLQLTEHVSHVVHFSIVVRDCSGQRNLIAASGIAPNIAASRPLSPRNNGHKMPEQL